MDWSTVAIFVVKSNCKSIIYCERAKSGCGMDVAVDVTVGSAVSVGGRIVAVGIEVSVGGTVVTVGAAHETIRKMQINESPILIVLCGGMELIVLDLRLSLNNEELKNILVLSSITNAN